MFSIFVSNNSVCRCKRQRRNTVYMLLAGQFQPPIASFDLCARRTRTTTCNYLAQESWNIHSLCETQPNQLYWAWPSRWLDMQSACLLNDQVYGNIKRQAWHACETATEVSEHLSESFMRYKLQIIYTLYWKAVCFVLVKFLYQNVLYLQQHLVSNMFF